MPTLSLTRRATRNLSLCHRRTNRCAVPVQGTYRNHSGEDSPTGEHNTNVESRKDRLSADPCQCRRIFMSLTASMLALTRLRGDLFFRRRAVRVTCLFSEGYAYSNRPTKPVAALLRMVVYAPPRLKISPVEPISVDILLHCLANVIIRIR